MKKSKANIVKDEVIAACAAHGIPFTKRYLRRAKRFYNRLPADKREGFTLQLSKQK